MNYIQTLYHYKNQKIDEIIIKDKNSFYLLNGYDTKITDIEYINKLVKMIDKWENTNKFVFNEISKNMVIDENTNISYKMRFKEFIHKYEIEQELIHFKNLALGIKKRFS